MIIVERDKDGYERSIELDSRLYFDRILWFSGHIDSFNAEDLAKKLLLLDAKGNGTITLFLNSPGGSVTDGLMIYDIFNTIRSKVDIICAGQCCSMAGVWLASATGIRYAYENATVMIHQVSSSAFGKEPDLEISLEYTKSLNDKLMTILSKNTNKPISQIYKDTERDNFMTAFEAKEYGLIDEIL